MAKKKPEGLFRYQGMDSQKIEKNEVTGKMHVTVICDKILEVQFSDNIATPGWHTKWWGKTILFLGGRYLIEFFKSG